MAFLAKTTLNVTWP